MQDDQSGPLELFIGANYGSIEKARVACLSALLDHGSVPWEVGRHLPRLTGRMIFTNDLADGADQLYLSSAYAVIEGAVSALGFRALLDLSREKELPRILRGEIVRKWLHSVSGAVVNDPANRLGDLIEIALWDRCEDTVRMIAADRAAGLITEPVPGRFEIHPDFGLFLEPRQFRELVFAVSDDLPIYAFDIDPLSRDRAMRFLNEAVRVYALSGCFRELAAIASDGTVPEVVRARATMMFDQSADSLIRKSMMRLDADVILGLLAVAESCWVSKEHRLEAGQILSDHADCVAEIRFVDIVKESVRPGGRSPSDVFLKAPQVPSERLDPKAPRESGIKALAGAIQDELRQRRVSRPPKMGVSG
ncbi:MAG: hypothetical protein U0R44_06490 [Candidatus Micrarchaeia archaeon]